MWGKCKGRQCKVSVKGVSVGKGKGLEGIKGVSVR